jgi:hypothetical protein
MVIVPGGLNVDMIGQLQFYKVGIQPIIKKDLTENAPKGERDEKK